MSQALEDVTNTVDATGIGVASGENGSELVIDVAGIVETPTSLDETTTATESAAVEVEEIPFDPSANTDAAIEPRIVETTDAAPETTTEQDETGNDVAEEGDDPQYSDTEVIVTEDDGEVLRDRLDIRAYKEFMRRRNESERHVGYLALGMSRAKVAAKAASDEFNGEVETLEKIVAGGWRAVKREMEAAGRAASICQDAADDAKKPVSAASVVESSTGDSIYGTSATLDAQAPSEAVSDAWRDCTIAELCAHGVSQSVMTRLDESGISTIGKLAQFVEDLSLGKEKRWPKGIGEAKVTMIEDALTAWLTKNRDSGTFGAIPTTEGDAGDGGAGEEGGQDLANEYPTTEAWDKMSDANKKDWMAYRVEWLEGNDDLKPRESEKAFNAGRKAWDDGLSVQACDYYPGARCDDWIRGWIVGSEQPEQVKAAAAPSTSVDDLFG